VLRTHPSWHGLVSPQWAYSPRLPTRCASDRSARCATNSSNSPASGSFPKNTPQTDGADRPHCHTATVSIRLGVSETAFARHQLAVMGGHDTIIWMGTLRRVRHASVYTSPISNAEYGHDRAWPSGSPETMRAPREHCAPQDMDVFVSLSHSWCLCVLVVWQRSGVRLRAKLPASTAGQASQQWHRSIVSVAPKYCFLSAKWVGFLLEADPTNFSTYNRDAHTSRREAPFSS